MQDAGQRDLVDVVPGARCQRALLTPAGHAAADEAWIACVAIRRPEPEPLHHAGAESLEQDVGALDLREQGLAACGRLQIEHEAPGAAACRHRVVPHLVAAFGARALDAQRLAAVIGEQHRPEGARPDAGQFDDPHDLQRAAGRFRGGAHAGLPACGTRCIVPAFAARARAASRTSAGPL